jgi:hypothetical protein
MDKKANVLGRCTNIDVIEDDNVTARISRHWIMSDSTSFRPEQDSTVIPALWDKRRLGVISRNEENFRHHGCPITDSVIGLLPSFIRDE